MSTTDRRAPSPGDRILVASEPWGRESGAWYEATVTAVDGATGLISASVEVPETGTADGEPGMTTAAAIVAATGQWRWPEKAAKG